MSDTESDYDDCECDFCTFGKLTTIREGGMGNLLPPSSFCLREANAYLKEICKELDTWRGKWFFLSCENCESRKTIAKLQAEIKSLKENSSTNHALLKEIIAKCQEEIDH